MRPSVPAPVRTAVLALAAMAVAGAARAADLQAGGYLERGDVLAPEVLLARTTDAPAGQAGATMGFTPRFGLATVGSDAGLQLGTLALRPDYGRNDTRSDETRNLALSSRFAGYEVGFSSSARLVREGETGAGGEVYEVSGALNLAGLQIGAAFERTETAFRAGEAVSAGLAYDFGALTTHVGVRQLTPALGSEVNVYSVGADFTLRPNLTLEGGFTLSEPVVGEPSTAGLVGLRLRF